LNLKVVHSYGKYDETTGRWSGMIGELIGGTADMAIADLTITDKRMELIDFSTPFMQGGITLLHKKPEQFGWSIWCFLDPFPTDFWLVIIASYILLVILYLIPTSLMDLKSEDSQPNFITKANIFLLKLISVAYTIFLMSIYVATLPPFIKPMINQYPIATAHDLASQADIKYGSVKSGSTEAFFKQSQEDVYQIMWDYMSMNYDEINSNKEGIEKVRTENGKYVFLMESTSAEYVLERKCDLTTTGGLLNIIRYGIGLPLNSSLRKQVNKALIKFEANGLMRSLKSQWWEQGWWDQGVEPCAHYMSTAASVWPTGLETIGGLYLLLIIGLVLIVLLFVIGVILTKYGII